MLENPQVYRFLFYASLVIIAVCCAVTAFFIFRNRLRPFARNLLLGLLTFELALALVHVWIYREDPSIAPFWAFFFDLQFELTAGAIFSAFQLTMIGMIALLNGWQMREVPWWERGYWFLLAATFVYLGLDEYHAYHETLGGRDVSEFWRIPYAIAGLILMGLSAAVFFYGKKTPLRLFIMIFAGLIIMAIAGIGIEEFVLQGFVRDDPDANWMYVYEELFEMVGATVALAGVLSCLQTFVPQERFPFAKRFMLVAGIATLSWYFFAQLLLPSLQARFMATPANVQYENGVELVAYRIEPEVIRPGDEVMLATYWRATEPQPEDYSFSAHAIMYPEGESVAQSDVLHLGVIPSQAWFPNVTMKQKYYIDVPRSMDAPASIGIMARVWYGPWPFLRPWQDTTGLMVQDTGQVEAFADDAVVLERITTLSRDTEAEDPAVVADYQFPQAAVTLAGYDLPEQIDSRTLPLSFWWQTADEPQERVDLSQFLHFVPQAEEAELVAFDRPPFEGRFPVPAWAAGMTEQATLEIPLDDLPAGTYDIYTGLYDWQNNLRYDVQQDGEPVQDNSVFLGSIEYDPTQIVEVEGRDLTQWCYGVANFDVRQRSENDTLIAIERATGAAEVIGGLGTVEVENLTMSADGSVLYGVEEFKEEARGLFGTIDLETGVFTGVGEAVTPADNPARNPAYGTDTLYDVDGIDIDRTTGLLWAVTQDAKNYLFQINPETGEVVRNVFGDGIDYVKVDLSGVPGAEYVDVEGFAIHPQTGDFYVIAASEAFDSQLARIDFDTLNPANGTVGVTGPLPFTSDRSGEAILDVEGLTFYTDGSLYATNSNNSNEEDIYDSLWRVDIETGDSVWLGSMEDDVAYVDYESTACFTGVPEQAS